MLGQTTLPVPQHFHWLTHPSQKGILPCEEQIRELVHDFNLAHQSMRVPLTPVSMMICIVSPVALGPTILFTDLIFPMKGALLL